MLQDCSKRPGGPPVNPWLIFEEKRKVGYFPVVRCCSVIAPVTALLFAGHSGRPLQIHPPDSVNNNNNNNNNNNSNNNLNMITITSLLFWLSRSMKRSWCSDGTTAARIPTTWTKNPCGGFARISVSTPTVCWITTEPSAAVKECPVPGDPSLLFKSIHSSGSPSMLTQPTSSLTSAAKST